VTNVTNWRIGGDESGGNRWDSNQSFLRIVWRRQSKSKQRFPSEPQRHTFSHRESRHIFGGTEDVPGTFFSNILYQLRIFLFSCSQIVLNQRLAQVISRQRKGSVNVDLRIASFFERIWLLPNHAPKRP
jgi:hypothetical protein